MEYLIVTLLTLDIGLFVLRWIWDLMQPKPLTFLELFNFLWNEKEELMKIYKEEQEKVSRQQLEQFLKIMDLLRKK